MKTGSCLISIALAVVPLSAQAALSHADQEVLEAFYEVANGEEWHRNDGWLQPGSDPCSWYGVECEFRHGIGRDIVDAIELPGNNLSGMLDTRIFEIVHGYLDLSNNELGGVLERLPASPGYVDLSDNRLSGNLPSESSAPAHQISGGSASQNWYLDLSGNEFEGEVPHDWDGPHWLNLANNRLEGLPLTLLEGSGSGSGGRFLDLSDNRFSGALPHSVMDGGFKQHNSSSRWGGGLNLCWNDWSIPESVEFQDWLRDHHVGGEFESCLGRERQSIGLEISGSWYDPDRSGEGIVVHQLDNGPLLTYFFTFDEDGRQQWLVDVQDADDRNVRWREMLQTRGRFGEGLLDTDDSPVEVRGSFRIDQLENGNLLAERVYIDDTALPCVAVYPPPLSCFGTSISDRLEYQRLAQITGTTCDGQGGFEDYSGAWYNPEQSGEGFVIEVLPDGRAIVYWFTYTPDGSGDQAWMIGEGVVGSFDALVDDTPPPGQPESRIEIETVFQPVGASFGPEFDPTAVELVDWGSLVVDFYRDGTGQVTWNSKLAGYGSGDEPIERLAKPKLADCSVGPAP